jgi:hypothetical protein
MNCLKSRRTKSIFPKINFLLISVLILSGAYYLVSINNLVVKNFKLQKLEQRVQELSAISQDLNSQKVSLESYNDISGQLSKLKMTSVGSVNYLVIPSDVVAKR